MSKKIALIHYPHAAATARIEARPFAYNIVKKLAEAGWDVDLYLWEHRLEHVEREMNLLNVNVLYQRPASNSLEYRSQAVTLAIKFGLMRDYRCVFAVGQIGTYLGAILAQASACPYVYLNDEFPGCSGTGFWARLERWAAHRADLIVLPDSTLGPRYPHLRDELTLGNDIPYVGLPNTALIDFTGYQVINWHERLGIPTAKKIFMHAGTLANGFQVPEILASVPYWPEDSVLLLHCHARISEELRQSLMHLDSPGRVYWSDEIMPDELFNSLVRYCNGCFALYRSTGPNLDLIGMSSGKLMRSLANGTPVIASHQASLSFVSDYQLGIQVKHPKEIPNAVIDLAKNRDDWRARCLSFAVEGPGSFAAGWEELLKLAPAALKGLDLHAP